MVVITDRERACRALLSALPGMSSLALPSYLRMAGCGEALWEAIRKGSVEGLCLAVDRLSEWKRILSERDPLDHLEELNEKGIRVLVPGDGEYPRLLGELYDPPPLLFVRGNRLPSPDERPYIGVVGSRKCSDYGRETATALTSSLAKKGAVIVSGAAYGIDGWAHRGCLDVEGFTVAVMGCGVDIPYPASHRALLEEISAKGAVISEYPPGTGPAPWRFPHRNRIIAGMSHFLLVVEAAERSGALITAQFALEEGREVGAVPGPVNSPRSAGTNALIQKGAKLVASEDDIWEELPPHLLRRCTELETSSKGNRLPGPLFREGQKKDGFEDVTSSWGHEGMEESPALEGTANVNRRSRGESGEEALGREEDRLGGMEKRVLESLAMGPKVLDRLVIELGVSPGEILSCLAGLKVTGLVTELAGGLYSLAVNAKGFLAG